MPRSRNKVFLLGYVGADPRVSAMPSGKQVVNLRLATSRSWKDRTTQEVKEATEWHNVVFFDALARVAAEHVPKGTRIDVEGMLRTRKWKDKDGRDQWTTEVIASELILLGSPNGQERATAPDESGEINYDDIPTPEE
jgi:single-strand DNA-binding protein